MDLYVAQRSTSSITSGDGKTLATTETHNEDGAGLPVDLTTSLTHSEGAHPEHRTVTYDARQEDVLRLETHGELRPVAYRLYKRRFLGVLGLFLLNLAGGMSSPWFGAIANDTAATFNISLTQVNWLANACGIVYIPVAFLMPVFVARYGVRVSCQMGAAALLLGAWLRYAGATKSLSTNSAYALLFLGQILSGGVAQAIFQVVGPTYSELWFNLNGRITVTMIIAVANLVGSAVAQLISPEVGGPRTSVLVLAILSTVISASCFLVGSKPPTPPTYAGSIQSPPVSAFLRAWVGLPCPPGSRMSGRERIDFSIIAALFAVLVAASGAFGSLTNQIFSPFGYDDSSSGLFGATLLLSGLVGSLVAAPLFDRIFTHHLSLFIKVVAPIVGILWFSLIWAVKSDNAPALFIIFGLIGICMMPMLPVGLELAVEVTRNAEASSATLFGLGNGTGVILLAIEDALRAGPTADPPRNMKRGLIFQGVLILVITLLGLAIRGTQMRRINDEAEARDGGKVEMDAMDDPKA